MPDNTTHSFNTITIVGLGLMGGSLCRAIRRYFPEIKILGVDKQKIAEKVNSGDLVDFCYPLEQLHVACGEAELIFVATPVAAALDLLPKIIAALKKETIVTDLCSIKKSILTEAERISPNAGYFIGGHPMAGSEKSGWENSDGFLFQNAIYTLSPYTDTPASVVSQLADFLQRLGAHVVLLDADTHDSIAASVSHLPRILSVALMAYIAAKNEKNPLYFKMAAGGFRDMTRIASGSFDIWGDIINENRQKILSELDVFASVLNDLRKSIINNEVRVPFEEAARTRLSIPSDSKGFLHSLYDLSVEVEDKPGVIASISGTLDAAGINIKDIEVLKVRENEGGTLRLAFSSENDRLNASELLKRKGYGCTIRQ